MINLDFTIESSEEREKFIEDQLRENPGHYTNSTLELFSNYILYGKDLVDGKSVVDRKEVSIKTKYNSFARKEPESLDALLESPTFNEGTTFKSNLPKYKKIKPSIDRKKEEDIPEMGDMWRAIDSIQHKLDVTNKKVDDPSTKPFSAQDSYKARHLLIEMRREQFTLRDFYKPTLLPAANHIEFAPDPDFFDLPFDDSESNYAAAPLGLYSNNNIKFINPKDFKGSDFDYNREAEFIIDFRNPDHIYTLLEHYEDLAVAGTDSPTSTASLFVKTIDFYIDLAHLSDEQSTILQMKLKKFPNEIIRKVLNEKYNITHTANYISTIYKQRICGTIAEAATLHYDYFLNRNNPFNWKKCTKCGEWKLKDTREFVRKSRSSDGLSSRCKVCDKKDRSAR